MKRKGRKWRRFVGNADNCRYRSPRRMQVYKPFRLRGPLDGGASNAPALSLSLSLSFSLCSSPRLPPQVRYVPCHETLFARFINQPSPSYRRAPLQFCNFNLIFAHRYRAGQTAIKQGRERERERERETLSGTGALIGALYFFRPLTGIFARIHARPDYDSRDKMKLVSRRDENYDPHLFPSPFSFSRDFLTSTGVSVR